jgi:AAA domain
MGFEDINDTRRKEGPDGVRARSDKARKFQPERSRMNGRDNTFAAPFGDHGREEPPPDLGELDVGDDTTLPAPRGWLLGNSFCRKFLSSVIAEGGTGKTALRYAQLLALATGRASTGEYVFQRARVLIVSLEDDVEEVRRRIFAVCLHYGINISDLRGWLYFSSPGAGAGKLMSIDRKGCAVRGALAEALEAAIIRRKIDLVALDPFVKTHAVPENDNKMIDEVAQILTDLAAKHNIAIDAPHHVRKGPSDPGNSDRWRGASGARDAARLVYSLTPMTPEEAEYFNIPGDKRRFYIRLDSAKVNLAPTIKPKWFKLVGVRLNNGTDLYPSGDEIQVAEPWAPPETCEGLDFGTINRILDTIDAGLQDGEELYTDENAAKVRAAWKAVRDHVPGKGEPQCREVIRQWVKTGLLEHVTYDSKKDRRQSSLQKAATLGPCGYALNGFCRRSNHGPSPLSCQHCAACPMRYPQ